MLSSNPVLADLSDIKNEYNCETLIKPRVKIAILQVIPTEAMYLEENLIHNKSADAFAISLMAQLNEGNEVSKLKVFSLLDRVTLHKERIWIPTY